MFLLLINLYSFFIVLGNGLTWLICWMIWEIASSSLNVSSPFHQWYFVISVDRLGYYFLTQIMRPVKVSCLSPRFALRLYNLKCPHILKTCGSFFWLHVGRKLKKLIQRNHIDIFRILVTGSNTYLNLIIDLEILYKPSNKFIDWFHILVFPQLTFTASNVICRGYEWLGVNNACSNHFNR